MIVLYVEQDVNFAKQSCLEKLKNKLNIFLFNPLVPDAHYSESQNNKPFSLPIQRLAVDLKKIADFICCTLGTNGLNEKRKVLESGWNGLMASLDVLGSVAQIFYS